MGNGFVVDMALVYTLWRYWYCMCMVCVAYCRVFYTVYWYVFQSYPYRYLLGPGATAIVGVLKFATAPDPVSRILSGR